MLRLLLVLVLATVKVSLGFSDVGKWDLPLNGELCQFTLAKSLFQDSRVIIAIACDNVDANLTVSYRWEQSTCSPDYFHYFEKRIVDCTKPPSDVGNRTMLPHASGERKIACPSKHTVYIKDEASINSDGKKEAGITAQSKFPPLINVDKEGIYILSMAVLSTTKFNGTVHIEMVTGSSYMSAAIYPLLPFFGIMCAVYTVLCASWLTVCALQWRDLLRIQYWIGGVALLGMVESATYYAVYSSIDRTGPDRVSGYWLTVCVLQWRDLLRIQYWIGGVALLGMVESATYYAVYSSIDRTGYFNAEAYMFAEWVSVAKRALARMLVIIVSLGFGIVKPRLGPALQRVVGTGVLWGILAAIEAWLRLHHKADDSNRDLLLSEAPMSLLDSAICWWVFVSLAHTMRTLQLRRNAIKLSLYRHFTNTLIFAVISSVVFMLYSIKAFRVLPCITDWKEVWMDEAYWHILFASVLTVIMVLWRPTNNNQRYAFTPLLDNAEDEDDEEEEQFVNDAYGVKMRGTSINEDREPAEAAANSLDSDLRWVEENIPTSTLPLLDSDEEIINTKFEVSKMQ